jgi:hypothetical protein
MKKLLESYICYAPNDVTDDVIGVKLDCGWNEVKGAGRYGGSLEWMAREIIPFLGREASN